MASLNLSFSGRDFTTEYERLISLLREQLPEYTDLNHSDVGMVLLALCARETDQLNYYIDRVAQEGFLRTLVFKQSAIELGRLVDYLPTLASPASTTLSFTRQSGITGAINIPSYSMFARSDDLFYTTIEDVTILSGEDTATVSALQGVVTEETVPTSSFSINEWSGQRRYRLPANTVGALFQMWDEEGEVATYWTQVDTFWGCSSTDKVFLLELVGDDTVDIVIGDGTFGASLEGITTLCLKYLVTSGPDGNCGAGVVTIPPNSLTSIIACSNTTIATGGDVAESLDSLRVMIPAATRTQRRGVTKEDYQSILNHIPGIFSSQAGDRNDLSDWPHLYMSLVVLPAGGGDITEYLRGLILTECQTKGHLGPWPGRYVISSAVARTVNISITVGVSYGVSTARVSEDITTNFSNLFASFGISDTVEFQGLFDAVMNVDGVAYVDFVSPTSSLLIDQGYVATLGNISITFTG